MSLLLDCPNLLPTFGPDFRPLLPAFIITRFDDIIIIIIIIIINVYRLLQQDKELVQSIYLPVVFSALGRFGLGCFGRGRFGQFWWVVSAGFLRSPFRLYMIG